MEQRDSVLIKMGEYIEEWKSSQDCRHIFLNCYRLMSGNMMTAVQNGEFHDSNWVNQLLHRFADYYFESLTCYDCGDQTPKVWHYAHKATLDNTVGELQSLILGVNAHINYDLVLALNDLLRPEWKTLSETKQRQRYEDHCHVNHVIAETIDSVQDVILEPLNPSLAWIDSLFGRIDEYLISNLITRWREEVWEKTQRLLKIETPDERESFRIKLEKEVLQRGNIISMF